MSSAPAEHDPPSPPAEKPKVIYVMGQGKSGSTILGVALGNCDGVFFAGELSSWLMAAARPLLGGLERVRFWRAVGNDVEGAQELFGPEAFHLLERAIAPLRLDRRRARRRLQPRYRRVTERLYAAVARRAEATHVVDTSHLPLRALELQSMPGIDLRLIFLVRNVESIVASHTRHVKSEDGVERRIRFVVISAHLWITYLLSLFVFLRQPRDRRLLVHHEQFVADPASFLREILEFADAGTELPDLASLATGIPFQGNALIRSQVVSLKPRAAPAHRQSRTLRVIDRLWTLVLSRLGPTAGGAQAKPPGSR